MKKVKTELQTLSDIELIKKSVEKETKLIFSNVHGVKVFIHCELSLPDENGRWENPDYFSIIHINMQHEKNNVNFDYDGRPETFDELIERYHHYINKSKGSCRMKNHEFNIINITPKRLATLETFSELSDEGVIDWDRELNRLMKQEHKISFDSFYEENA